MEKCVFPIGIESFTELRTENYYYVDKTAFIPDLLEKRYKVDLITRPRRFGKTLMMSMLADFLDIRKNSRKIFDGLAVSEDQEICKAWMNRWPTLFLTLKNVESLSFDGAFDLLKMTIADVCRANAYLEASRRVASADKETFCRWERGEIGGAEVKVSLYSIMRMMQAHFGKPVVLLIDEYDVPLSKARENGYYTQMLDVIRGMLGIALKTNPFLKFAVVTGCLRIAKESIFTGVNNFVSSSILDQRFQEYFGFTGREVRQILEDTGFQGKEDQLREWYDGYCFGEQKLYCPWDVLNHVNALQEHPDSKPKNYWKNTSGNDIIRSFIDRTELSVNEKFERLLAGQTIQEEIREDLTYDVLHASESNLWSMLYLTGYLTREKNCGEDGRGVCLRIPNEEIQCIFRETVAEWFRESMEVLDRRELFQALWGGEEKKAEEWLSDILFETISYHDYKESYYHAFMAGIFSGAGYAVESNREYGLGRPDIVVKDVRKRKALILEIKCSDNEEEMDRDCQKALGQIDARAYAGGFLHGYREVLCYGIAFYRKQCMLKKRV